MFLILPLCLQVFILQLAPWHQHSKRIDWNLLVLRNFFSESYKQNFLQVSDLGLSSQCRCICYGLLGIHVCVHILLTERCLWLIHILPGFSLGSLLYILRRYDRSGYWDELVLQGVLLEESNLLLRINLPWAPHGKAGFDFESSDILMKPSCCPA